MAYASYLRNLLAPLGIYALEEDTVSGAQIESLGAALDAVEAELDVLEREILPSTAQGFGLERIESLFARKPAAPTLALRRSAIAALMGIGGGDFTCGAIDRALNGCGIRAAVEETDTPGCVRVVFPNTVGEPEDFEQIRQIILDIIPCHLQVDFALRFVTWAEIEAQEITWARIEAARHTWNTFQTAYIMQ